VPIGIDRDGETYKAYGVSSYIYNCVIDPGGKIVGAGYSNNELFRVLKSLLRTPATNRVSQATQVAASPTAE
jgi:hypothetical protein